MILGIKQLGADKKHDEILKEIIIQNPNPFIKNPVSGWSALDEALS